ncbi:MAG: hypothetical protein O7E52_04795 [Candidatus Poribacteria bacterium]|nr:hypothetical protein [Candidatus Poribacteria bacterium]
MKTNSFQRFDFMIQALILIIAACVCGCDSIFDDILNGGGDAPDMIGQIVLHQTGGIAGVSNSIIIEEKEDSILLTSVGERTNQASASQVSAADLDLLWQTLEANDVFTLPSNEELLDTLADGFFYEISVERGEKRNRFSVYAPDLLASETGEERYNAIAQAIEHLADSNKFIIADLPVTDVVVEILESFPVQIVVVVNGFLRDGCTTLNETTERREGNTIHIHITTKRPRDAVCTLAIEEIQERIPLGTFPPGSYKVIVNGVEKDFRVQ